MHASYLLDRVNTLQDNLCMKFLALNVDFSTPSPDPH